METDLGRVRTELSEIHELLDLPVDAFDEPSKLKDRQNELRQLSHELIEGEPLHSREGALRAACERLHEVRDRLLELDLQHSSTSAGNAGIESTFTNAINKAIDAGAGLEDVEARIRQILEQMRSSR